MPHPTPPRRRCMCATNDVPRTLCTVVQSLCTMYLVIMYSCTVQLYIITRHIVHNDWNLVIMHGATATVILQSHTFFFFSSFILVNSMMHPLIELQPIRSLSIWRSHAATNICTVYGAFTCISCTMYIVHDICNVHYVQCTLYIAHNVRISYAVIHADTLPIPDSNGLIKTWRQNMMQQYVVVCDVIATHNVTVNRDT